MNFTYRDYFRLVDRLRNAGYEIADYEDWEDKKRCVILRHDIDNSIQKAVKLAGLEFREHVHAVYFVQLTSDFYNVFSKESRYGLNRLADYGHDIGLHFDETCYPDFFSSAENGKLYDEQGVREMILQEAAILRTAAGVPVKAVSMHRPGRGMLETGLSIPGMINSYGTEFFQGFKYLSDSRRHWREPVEEIVCSGMFPRLHILTHPFWYNDVETDMYGTLERFVNDAGSQRYVSLQANITDLEAVIGMDANGKVYRSGREEEL